MLDLSPLQGRDERLHILCIGAHCDDIELGCGGTLMTLQATGRVRRIDWIVLGSDATRRSEAEQAMRALVEPALRGRLLFGDFSDGSMPGQYGPVKAFFETLKELPEADLVFTHERDDRHQDHRIAAEMTWNTFRDHLILEYEIPKWDGGLGQPNCYVPIVREIAERKVATLLESHASQRHRDWFTAETFMALLRLRGLECRAPSGLAEAFHARKLRLSA